jgi:hypothetical protein
VAAAAVLAVVLGVVGWLVLTDDPAQGGPAETTVPDVAGRTAVQAVDALRDAGLRVGAVAYRHDAAQRDIVVGQSVAAGSTVAAGTPVDLVVTVNLSPPRLVSPKNDSRFPQGAPPPLTWTQSEPYIGRWKVSVSQEACRVFVYAGPRTCRWMLVDEQDTTSPQLDRAQLAFLYMFSGYWPGQYHTGRVQWTVVAVDDFGNAGPSSAAALLWVGP